MPGTEPCPLCNMPASYTETELPFSGKRFQCERCNKFVIDDHSEHYLAHMPEVARTEQRRMLSDKSQAVPEGGRLLIREPGSNGRQFDLEGQRSELITQIELADGSIV